LNDVDVSVLNGNKLSLINQFGVFSHVLTINLGQDLSVLILRHLLFLQFHLFKLFVEPLLFFFAFFLELLLILIKSTLFFDERSNRDDLMLLDLTLLNFTLESCSFFGDKVDLFLILLLFILNLSKLLSNRLHFSMKRSLLVGLLLDSRSKFFDFLVEGFFLLLVEKRWIILDLLFFQMLESVY